MTLSAARLRCIRFVITLFAAALFGWTPLRAQNNNVGYKTFDIATPGTIDEGVSIFIPAGLDLSQQYLQEGYAAAVRGEAVANPRAGG